MFNPSNANNSICRRINKQLIPLKIALFSVFAGSYQLLPFTIIFQKQRGFTPVHLSLLYGTMPAFQCILQLLSGIISDKTAKDKIILYTLMLVEIIFLNCILFIPKNENDLNLRTSHYQFNISDAAIQDFIGSNCTNFNITNGSTESCELFEIVVKNNCNISKSEIIIFCTQFQNASAFLHANKSTDTASVPSYLLMLVSVLILGQNVCKTVIFRIMDVTVMYAVKTFNSDFGKQRLWSLLGVIIVPPIAGSIIQKVSTEGKGINYSVAIIIYDICTLIALACVWKLNVKARQPEKSVWKTMKPLLKNIDVLLFFIVLIVSGSTWSFFLVYSPYYLSELGASSLLIGLQPAVQSIVGLPVVFFAENILNYIGNRKAFLLALLGHVVLCTSFSYLVNPWWSLLCCTSFIFTYHLMWVATVTHAHEISPPGVAGTMIVTSGMIHYSIGKTTGTYLGGFIMSKFGSRTAFRAMAAICGIIAILYAIFLTFQSKKNRKNAKADCALTTTVATTATT